MKRTLLITATVGLITTPVLAKPFAITVAAPRHQLHSSCADCGIGRHQPIVEYSYSPAQTRQRAARAKLVLLQAQAAPLDEIFHQGMEWRNRDDADRDNELGLALLTLAAQRGYRPAQAQLVQIYGSADQGIYWQEQLATTGGVDDWLALAKLYALREDDLSQARALAWYARAADAGDISTQIFLADHYEVAGDLAKAVSWYRRAADAGNSVAMMDLARLYTTNESLRDVHQALYWYSRAADAGVVAARVRTAELYDQDPALRDPLEAIRRYADAAQAGDVASAFKLCNDYVKSPVEQKRAALAACLDLYGKNRVFGETSLLALAYALRDGSDLPQDLATARKIFIGLRSPAARLIAGRMLVEGVGGPPSVNQGVQLIEDAAGSVATTGHTLDQADLQAQAEARQWLDRHPDLVAGNAVAEFDLNLIKPGDYSFVAKTKPTDLAGGLADELAAAMQDSYPERASDGEIEGRTLIRCYWGDKGRLTSCWIRDEAPKGYGFGFAGAKWLVIYSPTVTEPGWPAAVDGKWTDFDITWRMQ